MHTSYNITSTDMGVVRSILCSLLNELLCDDDMTGVRLDYTLNALFKSKDEGII